MKKKTIALTITAIMLLSTFAAIIPLANCDTQSMPIVANNGYLGFDKNSRVQVKSDYVLPAGWYINTHLQVRLLRTVDWQTLDDQFEDTYSQGYDNLWIKTIDWYLNGYYNAQLLTPTFYDTLSLTNLRYENSEAPNYWPQVHWVVGYRIKVVDCSNEVCWGDTGELGFVNYPDFYILDSCRIGHNEINKYMNANLDSGVHQDYGGIYTPDDALGEEDNYGVGLYGYNDGAATYAVYDCYSVMYPAEGSDIAMPPQDYALWVKIWSWENQPLMLYTYVGTTTGTWYADGDHYYPSGDMVEMNNIWVTDTASWWYCLGDVPYGTYCVAFSAECVDGSGIVWIDCIALVPCGEEPPNY